MIDSIPDQHARAAKARRGFEEAGPGEDRALRDGAGERRRRSRHRADLRRAQQRNLSVLAAAARSAPRIRRTAGPPRRSPSAYFRCSPTTSIRCIAPATSSRGTRSDLMPIRPDLILAHRFPEIRHVYTAARRHPLRVGGRPRPRSGRSRRPAVSLGGESRGVADLRGDLVHAGPLASCARIRRRFRQAGACRTGGDVSRAAAGGGRDRRLGARSHCWRIAARGGAPWSRSSAKFATQRSGTLYCTLRQTLVPPRRRRVWRTARAERALDHPRSPTGCARRIRRRSARGADLPALGRPESAAHRSGSRGARRFRSADPAWPGELRDRRHRGIARSVAFADRRRCPCNAVSPAWCSRATCSHSRFGGATGRRCFRASSAIAKRSIRDSFPFEAIA